jgi:hypothetical protein
VVTAGLFVRDGVGETDEHGFALARLSLLLPVALVLAVAEADALAVFVAGALALADAVAVPVGLPLSLGPAEPPAGPVLSLAGDELDTEPPGAVVGLTVLPVPGLAAVEEGLGEHAVDAPPTWPGDAPPGPVAPPGGFVRVPVPAGLPSPSLLEVGIPTTAEPSWAMASRSGGTARAMPMANTAQAIARTGRNSPYFHFHGCGRLSPGSPAPPRTAFQRRAKSARKPPDAPAGACLLA